MNVNPVEIIRRKRDGLRLTQQEIEGFITGAVSGEIPEYQVTALLMAIYLQGMSLDETVTLTKAMINSGKKAEFRDSKPKVDKHSTGGVGDKVSLILTPLVASLGVDVPMVAGRGLGHTGGTIDKLECIPGFQVRMRIEEFTRLVETHGMALMGQTEDFVPADKLLYALRDVTATVECIPLITASILSKKAAEGITALILDIKVGSGAFMKTQKDAEKLAKSLISVGTKLGLKVRAILTDMNQPLGLAAGHSLEVLECLDILHGKGPADLREVTVELAAHMLFFGEKSSSISAARAMARKALQNGSALEKFRELCKIQRATVDIVENPEALAVSSETLEIPAPKSGYLSKIDTEQLGLLLLSMGGGRRKTTDIIDPSVGFIIHAKLGQHVEKNASIATLYWDPKRASQENSAKELVEKFAAAYSFSNQKVKAPDLIKKVLE